MLEFLQQYARRHEPQRFREGHMAYGPNHINFLVRGTEDPTLIFVHGFACSLKDWEEQFRGLSPTFRCVALDLPGHGDSAKPETISIEIMGTAVNRVKDRIAAPSTILVGTAWVVA